MSNIWLICPLWGHQDFLLKTMYHFFPWVQAKHHKNSQPIPRFLAKLIWVGPLNLKKGLDHISSSVAITSYVNLKLTGPSFLEIWLPRHIYFYKFSPQQSSISFEDTMYINEWGIVSLGQINKYIYFLEQSNFLKKTNLISR